MIILIFRQKTRIIKDKAVLHRGKATQTLDKSIIHTFKYKMKDRTKCKNIELSSILKKTEHEACLPRKLIQ